MPTGLDEERDTAAAGLLSVDLVLDLIERLAAWPRPRGVTDIARDLGISKARAHRHLRALVARGYARQDPETDRYEIGVKPLILGEAVRERFGPLGAMRPEMTRLREATDHAVTASSLVDGAVMVLEVLQGRTLIEFGIRPGSRLELDSSAHGLVALAFGPPELLETVLARTPRIEHESLAAEVDKVRFQGWATAADRVLAGVNALAAPVFDHGDTLRGALAIVGSSQFIPDAPSAEQVAAVTDAAAAASHRLGWGARAA
ncbi:MAG TPA: IclR family transcriptional regulator [Caulobacteraceae bacterium]|nr:IclR family transcriptional regulator [Caulobacteraceae bacterium]